MNKTELLKKIEQLNDAVIVSNQANFRFGSQNNKENVLLWDQANANYRVALNELFDCVSQLDFN